jgi:hypothetical protein
MRKNIYFIIFTILLAGCAEQTPEAPAPEPEATNTPIPTPSMVLEDLGTAPELENEVWLNTEQPLRLADLRGKVVLLDMWTFG